MIEVTSRMELRRWLKQHHTQSESIWLVTWKAATAAKYVPYDAIVEEALCFGWIDSLPRKLDDNRTMVRLSPRKAGSGWSKLNKQRIERLIANGAVTAAGLAVIEVARADGSWTALDDAEALVIPEDLAEALSKNGEAARHFHAFPRSVKRNILQWISTAKLGATRERRIAETVQLAARNLRANHPRQARTTQ